MFRGGIYSFQEDNWVFKVSHPNSTRSDIYSELSEPVYDLTILKSHDIRKKDSKIRERNYSYYALIYKSDKEYELIGYYDNDYVGDLDDRKSTSGLIFFFGSKLIAWNCCKQKVIALSSCEAQYISSTLAVCEGIWISRFMRELSGCDEKRFDLCIDNKSAIEISGNPVHHGRTKHIEVQYHFIQKCVEEGKVNLRYVRTGDEFADLFTKLLGISKFYEFQNELVSKG